ncbi:TetR/AcrR family transcriptional regulator [Beijerinckia sp. L45]|uniref:TetR/AcrR family transcriptional regulator n=1 Tax=Beijerinckia sp. L45 TaxID=1641855 RepID=UPI00131DCD04|nr:TetR/AcrR family transcriptional regulator [Beijerinckia sp. L45]
MTEIATTKPETSPKARGGRPTKAAAIERDERLLAIAADMFMELGFEGTSMERLAETAMVGKATLYARYPDKGALFADVLRRKILMIYATLEEEFQRGLEGVSLEATLCIVGRRLLDQSLTPSAQAMGRILVAQVARFPELGRLAFEESTSRQTKLVEGIFLRFAETHRYAIDDLPLLAELYLSIVMGRTSRLKLLGMPVDADTLDHRLHEAVKLFVRGAVLSGP